MHEVAFTLLLAFFALAIAHRMQFFRGLAKDARPLSWKICLQGFLLFLFTQFIFLPGLVFFIFFPFSNVVDKQELQGWLNLGMVCSLFALLLGFCKLKWSSIQALYLSNTPFYDLFLGALTWLIAFPLLLVISKVATLILSDYFGFSLNDQAAVRQVKALMGYPKLFIFTIAMVIFIVPMIEELLFRGFLQSGLISFLSPKLSILFTSICFALFHFALSQGVNNIMILSALFLLSLFLGYLKERQGNLLAPMALHATFNAISVGMILAGNS